MTKDSMREALELASKRFLTLAHWRRDADAFDKDMDNLPRIYCEDVGMIEDCASGYAREIDAAWKSASQGKKP